MIFKLKPKKIALILFLFFTLCMFFINIISNKAKKIIEADIEIETVRLENAIKEYKKRTGEYPQLLGNENQLDKIKNISNPSLEKYTFNLFYGNEKLFEIPENLEKGIMKTNKIVLIRDNKGGWLYNNITGEIKANIEEKKDNKRSGEK